MTSTNPMRRTARRSIGRGGGRGGLGRDGRSAVGEKLRDAREVKGVDLYRVERDTKIRVKFLAALEDGDMADLPGDVYARGFLRNYATYLGMDADEIEEEWREEFGAAKPVMPTIVGPQPMTIHRGVVFQRSHLVIAMVVVIVLVVGAYFGYQLTRYLSYPTLAVSSAGPTMVTVPIGTTNYTLSGTATPGTTVLISWNGQESREAVADDSGHWTYQALLQAGSNQFDVIAKNLDTNHASQTIRLVVFVPTPTPSPVVPAVAFATPADGASIADGKVTVTGTGTAVSTVTLTPTYLGAPLAPGATLPPPTPSAAAASPVASSSPSAAPRPSSCGSPGPTPTPAPEPTTVAPAADGSFTLSLQLKPGLWRLSLAGASVQGVQTQSVARTVTVPYTGVNVTLQVTGGAAWLRYFVDGAAVGQSTYPDGWQVTVVGKKSFCVVSAAASRVYATINGVQYGPVSQFGGTHLYVDVSGVPKNVNSC